MIYYIAHWDWILFQSRASVVEQLSNDLTFTGIAPLEEDSIKLNSSYNFLMHWDIDRKKLIDLKGIFKLRKIIKNIKKNEIVHVFTLKSLILFLLSSLGLQKQFTTIASITGLGFLFSDSRLSSVLRKILKPFIRNRINLYVDLLIFQNKANKDIFVNYSDFKNDIELVEGSGLNISNFQIKENFNHKIKIIFVGRLLKDKGILEYLKLSEIFSKNDNLEFFVAGDIDPGNKSSITESELNKLRDKVTYLGNINVFQELKNYDLLISPTYHEGFSRVLLEAAYVGLYSIVNDTPGTREIINHLNCGKLISNNNLDEYVKAVKNIDQEIPNLETKIIRDKIIKNYSTYAISSKFRDIYIKYV